MCRDQKLILRQDLPPEPRAWHSFSVVSQFAPGMPPCLLPENEDYSCAAMHDAQYLLGSELFLTLM